jgi:hypothetical protein
MSSNTTTVNSGMGFAGWLTILFVGLKLTGFISWPWIWVISPIWISFLIALGFLAIILGIAVVSGIWK